MVAAVGRWLGLTLVVMVLLLAGCGGSSESGPTTTESGPTTTSESGWVPDYAAAAAWTSGSDYPETAEEIRDKPDLRGLCDLDALTLLERGWGVSAGTAVSPEYALEAWFGIKTVYKDYEEGEGVNRLGTGTVSTTPGPLIYFLCGPETFGELTSAMFDFDADGAEAADVAADTAADIWGEFLTNPGQ